MIITCGECDSSFILDDSLVKPSGSKVRCSNCKHVFVVYPAKPEVLKEAPAVGSYDFEDDPDLSKAVAAIDEKDLEFTDDELGVTPETLREDIVPKMAAVPEPKADIPARPVPEPVVESKPEPVVAETKKSEPLVDEDGEEILDFSDFEVDLEEDSVSADAGAGDEEELSLDLDEEDMQPDFGDAAEEEIDFSDLELELDGDEKDTEVIGVSMTQDETDAADTMVVEELQLDLADEDLGTVDKTTPPPLPEEDFSFEEKILVEEGPEEAAMVDDELDFSDLERELDGVIDEPAALDELDLGLDEGEPETVLMEEDELDFSEFELEAEEGKAVAKGKKDLAAEDEELDFSSLSKILDSEPESESGRPSAEEDLDLELDLDFDGKADGGKASLAIDDDEEELDFSDLEDLLDDLEKADAAAKSGAVEDLDLELDASIDQGAQSAAEEHVLADQEEDLDFSDVEAMLDLDDVENEELSFEGDSDSDLELELEMEGSGEGKYARIGDEEDPDIELELDLGDEDEEGRPVLELDEDDENLDEAEVSEVLASGQAGSDRAAQLKEQDAEKKKVKAKPRRVPPARGKSYVAYLGYALLVLVVLFLLYMSKNAIGRAMGVNIPVSIAPLEQLMDSIAKMNIPGISSFVAPEAQDVQGKNKLKASKITGRVIPGTKMGDLFVITGSVQNNYPENRNSISLVCKLFGKGGSVSQTKLFYAGNVIPETELVNMAETMIMKRIQNRLGDKDINADVKPGQSIPFMVVFTRLGDNLTEFSVEPAGSMPGPAKK